MPPGEPHTRREQTLGEVPNPERYARIEHVKRGEMLRRYEALLLAGFLVRSGDGYFLADWLESQRSDGAYRQLCRLTRPLARPKRTASTFCACGFLWPAMGVRLRMYHPLF
jgi:hypothetical protein